MMGLATQMADAVVAAINGNAVNWSIPFTASRVVQPCTDLKSLNVLTVSVIPETIRYKIYTRSIILKTCTVSIGIQKHIATDAEIVALGTLADDIACFMSGRNLPDLPGAIWRETENNPIYSADHYVSNRVFTSVVRLTYEYCPHGGV